MAQNQAEEESFFEKEREKLTREITSVGIQCLLLKNFHDWMRLLGLRRALIHDKRSQQVVFPESEENHSFMVIQQKTWRGARNDERVRDCSFPLAELSWSHEAIRSAWRKYNDGRKTSGASWYWRTCCEVNKWATSSKKPFFYSPRSTVQPFGTVFLNLTSDLRQERVISEFCEISLSPGQKDICYASFPIELITVLVGFRAFSILICTFDSSRSRKGIRPHSLPSISVRELNSDFANSMKHLV